MKRVLHPILLLAVLLAAMTGLAACGGGGDDKGGGGGGGSAVSDDTNAQDVLNKAFSGDQKIESGVLSVSLKGSAAGQDGSFTMSGPFENEGVGKLPKFDWDIAVSGGGQDIKAGVENTGSKAFVNYNGTEYVLDDATYKQFKSGYEDSAKQAQSSNGNAKSFADLGIDPASWLKDPKNGGDSDVDGTETVKVTGDVDVPKMLADVNTLIEKAGSSGAAGSGNVPEKLTQQQIDQAEKAIKKLNLEVEGAKSDGSIRRVAVDLDAANPDNTSQTGNGVLEIKVSKVGEKQDFPEPSGAKPFQQLLSQFGGLGALGGLGGGSSSGSGSSGSGGSSADQEKIQKYSQCIQEAGSDASKAQQCASLLG